ncbi:MAG: NAD(P)/FAD-dependent oxidoreductase, partial [Anaerolineae bacterium]
MRLRSGSHVAIVGGGPAGSMCALGILKHTRQAGLPVDVTIFEPRDFRLPGPWGCNMCAGLIPVRELAALEKVGIKLPPRVVRARIRSYTLHTAAGEVRVTQPDPQGDVVSVYRGNGPRDGGGWGKNVSLDGFLLEAARNAGAEVILARVDHVSMAPRPVVTARSRRYSADLVVLATGVNRRALSISGLKYRPPPRRQMAQTEVCRPAGPSGDVLTRSVHVFLPQGNSIAFGSLVPKGPCVSVSLLGGDVGPGALQRFLQHPEVQAVLPRATSRACRCRPHVAVGAGSPLFADRFVAVGDAGITNLYKNGIGAAFRTALRAADTAVHSGLSAADFRRGYGPVCRGMALDNLAGRFLFGFTEVFKHHSRLASPHLQAVTAEQSLPEDQRLLCRLLWGMFTGTYPYRQLLAM